jgi:hypothetical protein
MIEFEIGDIVRKHTGDYRLNGEVRAVFESFNDGPRRYVVAHDLSGIGGVGRILHIYAPANLELVRKGEQEMSEAEESPTARLLRLARERLDSEFADFKVTVAPIDYRRKIEVTLMTLDIPDERYYVAVFPIEFPVDKIVVEMTEIVRGKITEHRMDHLLHVGRTAGD